MKDWFKYNYGFVNIDSENLYLTNTGNWSETKGLEEKGKQKISKVKKYRLQLFFAIVFIISIFLYFKKLTDDKFSLIALIGFPIGLYQLYKYFKTDYGLRFKLPISKILKIEIVSNNVYINFLDFNKNEVNYYLEKVDRKGIDVFNLMKSKIEGRV